MEIHAAFVVLSSAVACASVIGIIVLARILVKALERSEERTLAFAARAIETQKFQSPQELVQVEAQRDIYAGLREVTTDAIEADIARQDAEPRKPRDRFATTADGKQIDLDKFDVLGPGTGNWAGPDIDAFFGLKE